MKKILWSSLLTLCAGLGFAQAAAANDFLIPGQSYIYIGGNYLFPDSDRAVLPTPAHPNTDTDYGGGIDLIYGRHWVDNWYLEAHASADVIADNGADTVTAFNGLLGGDLVYAFGDRLSFTPFILGGLGVSYNRPRDSKDDGASVYGNLGLGFTTGPLSDSGVRLRGEARYVYDNYEVDSTNERGMNDFRIGLGLEFPLGAVHMRETTKVVKVPVMQHAPAPPPPAPVDSDHDGVIDGMDKCPDSLPGARVDDTGCAIQQSVTVLHGVNFAYNSAKLNVDSQAILDEAVKAFQGQPDLTAVIAGYTDSRGSNAYNQRLSERRANSVRDYLITHGIAASRLSVRGYGEADPVDTNSTAGGRAQNRRVEFQLHR